MDFASAKQSLSILSYPGGDKLPALPQRLLKRKLIDSLNVSRIETNHFP